MKGFIKIPRDFIEWEWWNRQPHHALFEWLLIKARVVDQKVQGIIVRRGSVLTTWRDLQQVIGCSTGALSRALRDLSDSGEIIVRTEQRKTLVTICHYEDYNGNDDMFWSDNGTKTEQKRSNTPLYKGERENESYIYSACAQGSSDDGFVSVYDCRLWMQRYNKIAASFGAKQADKLSDTRRIAIQRRVRARGRGSVDAMFAQLEKSAHFFNDGSRGFRGDFTNLWSDDVYTKVCEGYYIPQKQCEERFSRSQSQKAASASGRYTVKASSESLEEHNARIDNDRRNTLAGLVRMATEHPEDYRQRTWADMLISAYESGELRQLGINWKPNTSQS